MTNAQRDLAAPELGTRSLERSRRRRALLPKARRENRRKKHVSAALATAVVAGPGTPLAAAQVTLRGPERSGRGGVAGEPRDRDPRGRAAAQAGSQGDLVVQVQRALDVDADGIFGVQTDAAVRSCQQSKGLKWTASSGSSPGRRCSRARRMVVGRSRDSAGRTSPPPRSRGGQTVERAAVSWPRQGEPGTPAARGAASATGAGSTAPATGSSRHHAAGEPGSGTTTVTAAAARRDDHRRP